MFFFRVVTIFPGLFDSFSRESIIGRAASRGLIKIEFFNPRDFTDDKHKKVDDRPFGGGPGMVMMAEPLLKTVLAAVGKRKDIPVFLLSARGRRFGNVTARSIAAGGFSFKKKDKNSPVLVPVFTKTEKSHNGIVIICGRYEGVDARLMKILRELYGRGLVGEVSVGSYVLTGGELAAMVMIDSIARHIPGVLGNKESLEEERTASRETYTRPETLVHGNKLYKVPKILLSGHHQRLENWRARRARPGLNRRNLP